MLDSFLQLLKFESGQLSFLKFHFPKMSMLLNIETQAQFDDIFGYAMEALEKAASCT